MIPLFVRHYINLNQESMFIFHIGVNQWCGREGAVTFSLTLLLRGCFLPLSLCGGGGVEYDHLF